VARFGNDGIYVITDKQYGATFTGTLVRVGERVTVVTVRDDSTEAERDIARQRAAEIVASREKNK